jgi:phosphodiesterase/alkaline phosphatase D-like protein
VLNDVPQDCSDCWFTTGLGPTGTEATNAFTFVVTADVQDANRSNADAQVYYRVAQQNPAFLIQIGDMDHRDPTSLTDMRTMRNSSTIAGDRFNTYIARTIPTFHIWDNHDFGSGDKYFFQNTSGCTCPNCTPNFGRRCDAWRAYKEYWPTMPLPYTPKCTGTIADSAGFFYKFTYGKAHFIVLDCRSQKDPFASPATMLGPTQKAWFKSELIKSRDAGASWIFVVTTVSFDSLAKWTTPYTDCPSDRGRGSWGAFVAERNEIAKYLKDNSICRVIWLSGDLHSGGSADDGAHTGYQSSSGNFKGAREFGCPHTNLVNNPTSCTMDPDQGESGWARQNVQQTPCVLDASNNQSGRWTWKSDADSVYASGYRSADDLAGRKPVADAYYNGGPGFLRIDVNTDHKQVRVRSLNESGTVLQYRINGTTYKDLDFTISDTDDCYPEVL